MYGSVKEDVILIVETADFLIESPKKALPIRPCIALKDWEARADRPERGLHKTLVVRRACLFNVVHCCAVEGDAGSVKVCECTGSGQHAPVSLLPTRQDISLRRRCCCSAQAPD